MDDYAADIAQYAMESLLLKKTPSIIQMKYIKIEDTDDSIKITIDKNGIKKTKRFLMISSKPFFMYLAEHKITQEKFCEMANMGRGRLVQLRHGTYSLDTLNTICETLNINIEDILRYEED